MDSLSRTETDNWQAEQLYLEFEQSWRPGDYRRLRELVRCFPPEQQGRVRAELLRIDMELSASRGTCPTLEDYLREFPELAGEPGELSDVAFEHYRLNLHGSGTDGLDRYRRLGIDVSRWRILTAEKSSGGAESRGEFPAAPGRLLNYELLSVLGEGAFSRVYLARQDDLAGRPVVLKCTLERTDEPDYLALLQHTHIVPIHSVHRVGSLQAICMPFLGSLTLQHLAGSFHGPDSKGASGRELISTVAARQSSETVREVTGFHSGADCGASSFRQPIDQRFQMVSGRDRLETVALFMEQVAEGLAYAHARGVIHGDVKPANILVSDDGAALLLDFNLSRGPGLRSAPLVGGTLPYMSPEQLQGLKTGIPGGPASDIWSLGAVMYELLTGQRPFADRGGSHAIDQMIADRESAAPGRFRALRGLDQDLAGILERCLEPDPARQYRSADELVEDLRCRAAHLPLKHAARGPWLHRARKWTRRHPRLVSVSSVLLLCGLLLAVVIPAYVARGWHLDRLAAVQASRQFVRELQREQLALILPDAPPATAGRALQAVENLLREFEAENRVQHAQSARWRLLDSQHRAEEQQGIAAACYAIAGWLASQAERTSDSQRRQELLDRAAMVNRSAVEYLPGGFQSFGVTRQKERIVRLQAGQASRLGDSLPAAETPGPDAPAFSVDALMLAAECLQQGQTARAEQLLRDLVHKEPENSAAWLLLGNARAIASAPVDAVACFSVCIAQQPDLELAWFNRARAHQDAGDPAAAMADFSRAMELNPLEPASPANRGQLRLRTGDADGAIADFSRAIELESSDPRVWYYRSQARSMAGDADGAAADLRTFLGEEPVDADGWALKSFVLQQQGRLDEALEGYAAALARQPHLRTALQNRAHILAESLGRTTEAIREMDRLVEAFPDDPVAIATRGVLWARSGNRQMALADARRALELDQSAETMYRVAGIHALLSGESPEDGDRAVALVAAALLGDPATAQWWDVDPDIRPVADRPEIKELRQLFDRIRGLAGLVPASPDHPRTGSR